MIGIQDKKKRVSISISFEDKTKYGSLSDTTNTQICIVCKLLTFLPMEVEASDTSKNITEMPSNILSSTYYICFIFGDQDE